ncbi:MAG: hypothetical protein RMN25_06995 [Anaerolineae bacterium]|nr:hypothetical protein [Thermoflexales bacterium]MDW8407516.1 hypothetical protein [Anaerolineae bacterium]
MPQKVASLAYIVGAGLVLVGVEIARRRGRVRPASWALVGVMWVIVKLYVLIAGSTRTIVSVSDMHGQRTCWVCRLLI